MANLRDTIDGINEKAWEAAMAGADTRRPWQVSVYVAGSVVPTRVFDRYRTERDATAFAEVLQAQAKRNGWTHTIRVERSF